MSLVYKFRLTKLLYDQVMETKESVDAVLLTWDERDYADLCEYVTNCKGVVPKYIARLARACRQSPRGVVLDILSLDFEGRTASNSNTLVSFEDAGYIPDDSSERCSFLQDIVGGQEQVA